MSKYVHVHVYYMHVCIWHVDDLRILLCDVHAPDAMTCIDYV